MIIQCPDATILGEVPAQSMPTRPETVSERHPGISIHQRR
jgi:hypothetical protein